MSTFKVADKDSKMTHLQSKQILINESSFFTRTSEHSLIKASNNKYSSRLQAVICFLMVMRDQRVFLFSKRKGQMTKGKQNFDTATVI